MTTYKMETAIKAVHTTLKGMKIPRGYKRIGKELSEIQREKSAIADKNRVTFVSLSTIYTLLNDCTECYIKEKAEPTTLNYAADMLPAYLQEEAKDELFVIFALEGNLRACKFKNNRLLTSFRGEDYQQNILDRMDTANGWVTCK